jgi:hypothetical protein
MGALVATVVDNVMLVGWSSAARVSANIDEDEEDGLDR